MRVVCGALTLLVGVGALGCGGSAAGPQMHPAKGKVTYKDDGKPVTGGMVQFESTTDPNRNGQGAIGNDGGFTLACTVGNKRVDGLAEGSYKATVSFPQGADQSAPPPVTLPGTYKVEPNGSNDFALAVPGKAKAPK
jgi:hypothetical protein